MTLESRIREFSSSSAYRKEVYIFSFFLLAFIIFACCNDWMYDESTSYIRVQGNGLLDLLTYNKFKLANNHLINSLYFRLLQHGNIINIFWYRIISLASFLIFFTANSRILKLLKINSLFIVFLIVTPYFFYFSYGRGYALAISCFAMCFYYLLMYSKERIVKYEYLIIFFGALSCLAIFSFLYGFLSILIVYGIFKLKHLKSIHTLIQAVIVIALLLYVYKLGKIVNANDPFIIGSSQFSLFKYGTVSSIFADFSYREYLVTLYFNKVGPIRMINDFKYFIMACLIIPVFYVRKESFRKIALTDIKIILGLLIFLPFLFMIAANTFANALYPLTRAVFYIHYLLLLLILFSTATYSKKLIFYVPVVIVCLTSVVYCAYAYYDLSRPTNKDALLATKNYPLYVMCEGDKSIILINKLSGINKKNLIEGKSYSTPDVIPLVLKDTSKIRYIIAWPVYRDSDLVYFKHTRIYKYRDGNSLIEILR